MKSFICILLILTCLNIVVAGDEWGTVPGSNDPCKEGGQCMTMMQGYESLIEGEGCRSFFTTGKCKRLCAFSLKSLIGRKTWSRCSNRCEWSTDIVSAAQSWLSMCLSKPADDVHEHDDHDHDTNEIDNHQKEDKQKQIEELNNQTHKSHLKFNPSWRVFHSHYRHSKSTSNTSIQQFYTVLFLGIIALVSLSVIVLFIVSVRWQTPFIVVVRKALKHASQLVKSAFGYVANRSSKKFKNRGVLDGSGISKNATGSASSSSSSSLFMQRGSSLNRGARRHLKAMRANVD